MDCGPTCLRMIAKYHGRSIPLEHLRNKSQYGKEGVSLLGLAEAAETIGGASVGDEQGCKAVDLENMVRALRKLDLRDVIYSGH